MPRPSASAPRCLLCEAEIEPGEAFKAVQAYVPANEGSRRLPANEGDTPAVRIMHRAVHYSCELEAIAAAAAEHDAPTISVDGEDDDAPLRDKLARLMHRALTIADLVDDLF